MSSFVKKSSGYPMVGILDKFGSKKIICVIPSLSRSKYWFD